MNCENYVKFASQFKVFGYAKANGYETRFKTDLGNPEIWFDNLKSGIEKAKIFEIDETIKKMLLLTEPPKDNSILHLPFDVVFLDVHFTKEEAQQLGFNIYANEITGILFRIGNLVNEKNEQVGRDLNISVCLKTNEYIEFSTYMRCLSDEDEKYMLQKGLKFDDNALKMFKEDFDMIHKFIINFLNFVNNPEIEIVENKRSEKNIARKKQRGEIVIPSSTTIVLSGHLKAYVDKVTNDETGSFSFGYRFWVKGHFRTLRAARYKNKKKLWVFPFIKGQGLLIEKTYKVKQKDDNGRLQVDEERKNDK